MTVLVLATNNQGKVREFRDLLADLPITVIAACDAGVNAFPPETGATFAENARAKARFVTTSTGKPALADDSGLIVDALGGAPGVLSARFGGDGLDDRGRSLLLLERLQTVPQESRAARFIAALALSLPDGRLIEAAGVLEGTVVEEPRGSSGFGYDPVFIVGGTDRTLAEMRDDEKNAISHRARAFETLRPRLIAVLSVGEN